MRNDILSFIEKFSGISRYEIFDDSLNRSVHHKIEATESIAYFIDEMIETIMDDQIVDEIDPVAIKSRPDGMTYKVRDIACLSIPHQLLGHIVTLGLEPLLHARILPTQHASIPGRGQTKLKRQIGWYLRRKKYNINYVVKTDVIHAYASVMYDDVIKTIQREIPRAKWIIKCLKYLRDLAPNGHLIIGGYIDAWLFNLMMSYAVRDLMKQGSYRRDKFHPYVTKVVTYMDDFCILTETLTGARKAILELSKLFRLNLKLKIKQTSSILELYSMKDERRAKYMLISGRRGCPGVDMGGFEIHRSYVTIRPRIFKRITRCFSRAWKEIQNTGTIQYQRAIAVISRFGYVKQTTSKYLKQKYHIFEILKMAKNVIAYVNKIHALKIKERISYAVSRHKIRIAAFTSYS